MVITSNLWRIAYWSGVNPHLSVMKKHVFTWVNDVTTSRDSILVSTE